MASESSITLEIVKALGKLLKTAEAKGRTYLKRGDGKSLHTMIQEIKNDGYYDGVRDCLMLVNSLLDIKSTWEE